MITEAIILGDVEAAVYRKDGTWRAVRLRLASDGSSLIDCSRHLSLLLSSGAEQRCLPEPLRDLDELAMHLRVWSRRHRALTMMISGMDAQLTDKTRYTCIQAAEQLLDDSDTAQFVRARLLSCPLPDEADLVGGLSLASEINASKAEGRYKQIANKKVRVRIIRARKTLDRVLFSPFNVESDPETARRTLIDAGVLADAVLALDRDDLARFDELRRTHADTPILAEVVKEPATLVDKFLTLLNEPHFSLPEGWRNIASVLRENNQWYPSDNYLIGLQEVRSLITAIWNTDATQFPGEMRHALLKSMPWGATRLSKFMKRATGPELVQAAISCIRVYLCCSKIREANGTLHWLARLSNLRNALYIADRSRFFSDRAKYLEYALWQEIEDVANELPTNPADLLKDSQAKNTIDVLNLLGDAAEVFRFAARIYANFRGERDDALAALQNAHQYFEEARRYLNEVRRRRRSVFQHWARALMLEAKLLLYSGHEGLEKALHVLENAVNLLKTLTAADYSDLDDPEEGWTANRILQAQALIEKARILPEDPTIAKEVEEILGEAILKRPEDAVPRKLLLDYYFEVKQNAEAALDSLDCWVADWKAKAQGDKSTKRGVHYLQYLAAHLCSIASRDDMSLAVPAVQRFAVLLRDQPSNTKATEELIDFLDLLSTDELEQAREIIDNILPRLSSEKCNVTHAVVRLLMDPVNNDIEKALAVVESKAREPWVWPVLELLSKKYFEHERRNPFEHGFVVSNRLLNLAMKANPNDAIWMSRQLDIMRFRCFGPEVQELIDKANQRFSHDPIIKLQTARLLTAHGTSESLSQANHLLHEAMAIEQDEGTGDVHPAILDQLAYLAFLRDDLDEAERLYQDVLNVYRHDSRAHFGLGRVCFERGVAYWPRAFDEWLVTVRAQLLSDEPEAPTILWRTVCALAGLCDARYYYKFSGVIRSKLLEQLKNVQHREGPAVTSSIVEALQVLGIVDQPVVLAVLDGVSDTVDRRLRRGVAQFLMASTIYSLLGAGVNGVSIRPAIEWCRERGVLAEYLAGAKGSYQRALMRLHSSGRDVGEMLRQLQGVLTVTALNSHWDRLFDHLATLGYKPNYYSDAYRLVDEMNNPPTDQLEDFVRHLVWDIAHRIWANYSDKEALLETLKPSPSLCPLGQVLPLEEHECPPSSIGGWVDVDALEFINHELEREQGERSRWHVQGAELVCEIPALWNEKNISAYAKFGPYFRRAESSDGTTRLSCCIDLSPGLERAA